MQYAINSDFNGKVVMACPFCCLKDNEKNQKIVKEGGRM
jgi:hypothetical protein